MDAQLLNRVGIVFSTLGGFLIAPELIGMHRIKKLEAAIEKILFNTRVWLDNYLGVLRSNDWIYLVVDPYDIYYSKPLFSSQSILTITIYAIEFIYVIAAFLIIIINQYTWSLEMFQVISISFVLSWGMSALAMILHFFHKGGSQYMTLNDLGKQILYIPLYLADNILSVVSFILMVILLSVYLSVLFIAHALITFVLRILIGNNILQSVFVWTGITLIVLGSALQFIATF